MGIYIKYHNKIQGFEEVGMTVKMVEKIAASSVHFLKKRVAGLYEYADNMELILARLSLFYQVRNHPLLRQSKTGDKALVIIAGDKGLVGGLWHAVINSFLRIAGDYQSVMVIGSKGENFLKEEHQRVVKVWSELADIPELEEIDLIKSYIFNEFKKARFSTVDVLYPKFISLAEQKPVVVQFLPFAFSVGQAGQEGTANSVRGLPIFEPTKQQMFDRLLQKYIGVYLHKIVLEAKLSEFSARTVAMEHASVQTKDLIQRLNQTFRKERHRDITQRQLESFAAHKM